MKPRATPNHDDPRLEAATTLRPGNAVGAIICVGGGYLLQLRSNRHDIFFPAHWGCFGGGVEDGESEEQALARELTEELGLSPTSRPRYFSQFTFDLKFAGLPGIWRSYYELEWSPEVLDAVVLGEGDDHRVFGRDEILLGTVPLVPYDAFALWLHINRTRLGE